MITGQGDDDVDSLIQALTDVIVSAGDMTISRKTFKLKKKKKLTNCTKNGMTKTAVLCYGNWKQQRMHLIETLIMLIYVVFFFQKI